MEQEKRHGAMSDKSPHSRVSRSRRVIALMAWGFLVGTALLLWNAQQTGTFRSTAAEPIAFLLAAFGAFVGVFAWMLFNPNQRTTAESPSLFLAAAATLFPPPVIGFCLMPFESPLRWWLALAIFLLVVIAILSHVPDEFFGVPRGRHSYVVPLPAFDRMSHTVMDPNASWFTFNDLSTVVADGERPSLAPRSYLNRELVRRTTSSAPERRVVSEVDDILGSDFDLGLLDDAPLDLDSGYRSALDYSQDNTPRARNADGSAKPRPSKSTEQRPAKHRTTLAPPVNSLSGQNLAPEPTTRRQRNAERQRTEQAGVDDQPSAQQQLPTVSTAAQYPFHSPESGHLLKNQLARKESKKPTPLRYRSNARRHAESLTLQSRTARSLSEAYSLTSATQASESATKTPTSRIADSAKTNSIDFNVPVTPSTSQPSAYQSPLKTTATGPAVSHKRRPAELSNPVPPATRAEDSSRETYRREQRDVAQQSQVPTPSKRPQNLRSDAAEDTAAPPASLTSSLQTGASLFGIPVAYTAASQLAKSARQSDVQKLANQPKAVLETRPPTTPDTTRSERPSGTSRTASRYDQPEPNSVVERSSTSVPDVSATTESIQASSTTSTRTKGEATAIQRTKAEDGSELVEGVMKIRFDKGQKRANLHIPFSPPLPGTPEVECECVDDSTLRLKVPVRQSYGIRIEARRTDADEALEADIGFAAVYTAE